MARLIVGYIVVCPVDGRLVGGAGSEEKSKQKAARISLHDGVPGGGKES